MVKRKIDWAASLRFAEYLRVSDKQQNERSPDQQHNEIVRTLKRLRRSWKLVKIFRDDGFSVMNKLKRLGFQKMLRDIRSGVIQVDLILVDTFERIGRNDELDQLRRELDKQHGVLIVQAKNDFADPTTQEGRIYSAFEAQRAVAENETKAHQVRRGKRDQAELRFWPGGPIPFGLDPVPEFDPRSPARLLGSRLVPSPKTSWIVELMFQLADENDWGQTLIAQSLNTDPKIPPDYLPFHESTVGRRLRNPIYIGELWYNKVNKEIVDDVYIVEQNPESEIVKIPNFCKPLTSKDRFDRIQTARHVRNEKRLRARASREENGKQIQPLVPGASVKHFLAGLAVCSECRSGMVPMTSGRKSKAGKSYAYYVCPRSRSGGCSNSRSIPMDWLEKAVLAQLRQQLFQE
jgi:DNA invertase Pin-like site-specific DNA recombinase